MKVSILLNLSHLTSSTTLFSKHLASLIPLHSFNTSLGLPGTALPLGP